MAKVSLEIKTVEDFLKESISIPIYQRAYSWTRKNVLRLIDDIREYMSFDEYRIGSIILHRNENRRLDVVDGQQRLITFHIIASLLKNRLPKADRISTSDVSLPKDDALKRQYQRAIFDNRSAIEARFQMMDTEAIVSFSDFFLRHCTLVRIETDSVDEAFQMFDSQNSRGLALDPTDLLKAYHLREMHDMTREQKRKAATSWESIGSDNLSKLFGCGLYRIRRWSEGERVTAPPFTANDVDMFKGIGAQPSGSRDNRALAFLYAWDHVRQQNEAMSETIERGFSKPIEYPYQIDQPVINGLAFFDMVSHYYELCRDYHMFGMSIEDDDQTSMEHDYLPKAIESLDVARGDQRISKMRALFDALLLYYVDRFGDTRIDEAADLIFRYAYYPRLQRHFLTMRGIDRYVSEDGFDGVRTKNLFVALRKAASCTRFLGEQVAEVPHNEVVNSPFNKRPESLDRLYLREIESNDEQHGAIDNSCEDLIELIKTLMEKGVTDPVPMFWAFVNMEFINRRGKGSHFFTSPLFEGEKKMKEAVEVIESLINEMRDSHV